jgi:hypothetical protein
MLFLVTLEPRLLLSPNQDEDRTDNGERDPYGLLEKIRLDDFVPDICSRSTADCSAARALGGIFSQIDPMLTYAVSPSIALIPS